MSAAPGDTIFAPATAPGGAIAVLRLSGPDAHAALAALADLPTDAAGFARAQPPGRLRVRSLRDADGRSLDEAMVVAFHAPRSYTGEPMVELHLHGSAAVVEAVGVALRGLGLRPAGPGEFTRRAYLAGKRTLLQAEAIADLVSARSEAARSAALAGLDGRTEAAIAALRTPLVAAVAEVEARLDFGLEDDVDTLDRDALAVAVRERAAAMRALAATADAARLRLHGARVVLHGPPNAGKSTLLNALCEADRALVHDSPGTTRDVVEVPLMLAGLHVTLVDTAGVREVDADAADALAIEAAGIARARAALDAADVVLWLRDAADPDLAAAAAPPPVVPPGATLLALWSRADRAPERAAPADVALAVSALEPADVQAVRDAIAAALRARVGETEGGLALLRARHADALQRAAEAAERGAAAALDALPLEYVAADLRDAVAALDELIGRVAPDDVLDVVFSRFCIGK